MCTTALGVYHSTRRVPEYKRCVPQYKVCTTVQKVCTTLQGVYHTARCVPHCKMCTTPQGVYHTARCVPHCKVCTTLQGVYYSTRCVAQYKVCTVRFSPKGPRNRPQTLATSSSFPLHVDDISDCTTPHSLENGPLQNTRRQIHLHCITRLVGW